MANIETKEIGIDIGIDKGVFSNTKIEDDTLILDYVLDDNDERIYRKEGSWTSEVIDLVDKFKEYDKVVLDKEIPDGANYAILVRVSDNGNDFSEYVATSPDGSFLLEPKRYVQVRIDLFAGFDSDFVSYGFEDEQDVEQWEDSTYIETTEGSLKLKRSYSFDMNEDTSWSEDGKLHRKLIQRNQWKKINSLEVE